MAENRGLRGAIALVLGLGVLIALGYAVVGLRDTSGETPSRTSGQTFPSTPTSAPTAASETDAPASDHPSAADPTGSTDPTSGLPWVSLGALPPEVQDTLDAIDAGPPYPYDRDGVTFENREGLLPDEEYGYYQEFTVATPGSDDRGARRVVWGLADEFYYTDDHYASFVRIQP